MDTLDILNKTLLFVGKRKSGKSNLCKHIINHNKHLFTKIYIISPTEKINGFFKDITPNIFDDYSEEWIEQLIDNMTKINANKPQDKKINILLVLDDLIGSNNLNYHHSPSLAKLYSRGRHINITIINIVQYLNALSPLQRLNTDCCFCGMVNNSSIEMILNEYVSGNISKNDFLDLYKRATLDYSFLVINNCSTKTDDLNEIYGILKSPTIY